MNRRDFLKITSTLLPTTLAGCGYFRINPYHPYLRSSQISESKEEMRVLGKARLFWTPDSSVRVLHVRGTPYERGYQQGVLLKQEVQDNMGYMYRQALKKFHTEELFVEAYERLRPFTPEEYIEEMHGLAHGSEMPLNVIHYVHALPCIGEWGGKKKLRVLLQQMMDGELNREYATTCSNLGVFKTMTEDGKLYTVRILDWGLHRISKLHQYPLITIEEPEKGNISANIGWVGFLGAISGINEKGITLGEMGYGDPPNETLNGTPMPFMLRDVLTYASDLKDVRKIIKNTKGTTSFAFLMSDGKASDAELYLKDRDRFVVFRPGEDLHDGDEHVVGLKNAVFGGHYTSMMRDVLANNAGKITPEFLIREMIPKIALKSNFQNVVYDPKNLRFWVSNAKSPTERAAEQPYTLFDFGEYLKRTPNL